MSKAEKEAAVYGHKGTTLLETAVIIGTMPFLLSACASKSFVEDIIEIAIPLLFAETIAADHLPAGIFTIPLCCILVSRLFKKRILTVRASPTENSKEIYLLTVLRGTTVLFTVITILAVDFPSVFPRRYVKTEWYGAGLMDIGVGAYVFTGAVVRGSKPRKMSIRELITTLVVFVMGFVRAWVNKSVDYQEHVSEYGVHWNFFVTLIMIKLICDTFSHLFARGSNIAHLIAGCTLLCVHQYMLSNTVIGDWVMADADSLSRKQESIFWQNKEGLVSLAGYVAIDLCTRGSAEWLLRMTVLQLLALDVSLWTLLFVLQTNVQLICRRSANAPFVIWMFAIGVMLLLLSVYLLEGPRTKSPLMGALSRQQFPLFILSNLITGLVNLTFDTLHASLYEAMGLLIIYVTVVCGIAFALEKLLYVKRNEQIKQT